MTQCTIGIDISKDNLDVYCTPEGAARQFRNTKAGHRNLIAWINKRHVERIVYEPTGPYHRELERAIDKAGLPIVKVNPRKARRFAETIDITAKTDAIDAYLLAQMGQLLALAPRPVASDKLNALKELNVARQALIKDQTATKNRQKCARQPLLIRQCKHRLCQIKTQIAAIECEINRLVATDAELTKRFDILVTIPGVSKITAMAMLIDMPELGSIGGKQAASLAGLAPVTRQSGRWSGRAFIRGGRAQLRKALYMPALVAIRYNPDMKAKYQSLIAAGKPAKIAIVAVMRKLIILANALLRDNRKWQPNNA